MNILPFVVSWAVLATIVLALALYRKMVARKEDDFLHVNAANIADQQITMAKRLEKIDKWGKLLTIIAAVYSVVVLAVVLYNAWTEGGRIAQ